MVNSLYIHANNDRLLDLLGLYRQGLISPAEEAELRTLLQQPGARNILVLYNIEEDLLNLSAAEETAALEGITVAVPQPGVVKRHVWRYLAVAAILAFLMVGGWLLLSNNKQPAHHVAANTPHYKNDVLPGGDKAVLTLANGKQVVLDDAAKGAVAEEGNTKVIKLNTGMLSYQSGAAAGEAMSYHTITTPNAGKYTIVLADGSSVWLNAASSLRFPVAFTGRQRMVEMTGEAYFEIAKNAKQPFIVKTRLQEVQVLGTDFNISAYTDEDQVRTTLLRGSVRVTNGEVNQQLIPGQQAVADEKRIALAKQVDVEDVMAWKNGIFRFNESTIDAIMKQVARWYDVEVVYQNNNRLSEHFMGNISRNVPLSEVLHLLELTGSVQFSIEGKKIIVR